MLLFVWVQDQEIRFEILDGNTNHTELHVERVH